MRSAILTALLLASLLTGALAQRKTENVILVTLDGLRWQDVFTGADNRMMNKEHGGVRDLLATRRQFWRGEPVARRECLMPFLWQVIAKQGQLFGDPEHNARARISNPHKFSYPGYSELLCGIVDERIDSNRKFPNPNVTVLEFLQQQPAFADSVATFSGWDVHESIVNETRSGVFCEVAWQPITVATSPARKRALQQFADGLPRYWSDSFCFDALTFARAKEYLEVKRPRVLYLALGETDEWAHGRRYDLYLQMARNADAMLRELWQWLQNDEQYRGKTSLVLTVDHGRGRTERNWTDHNASVDGAEEIWMAVMGPDTPALGVRKDVQTTQAQIAATVAHLLGHDFRKRVPTAAAPLPGVTR